MTTWIATNHPDRTGLGSWHAGVEKRRAREVCARALSVELQWGRPPKGPAARYDDADGYEVGQRIYALIWEDGVIVAHPTYTLTSGDIS